MSTGLKTKLFLGAAALALVFLFVKTTVTEAATTSTLRGWAWFGQTDGLNDYLSFDCADDYIGDLFDDEGNLYNFPEPRGFHFYAEPCSSLVHGVSISPVGNFSGQAWHNSLGLVSFNGVDAPPNYDFNVFCPSTCDASNNCWACYSTTTQQVYGWARVDNTPSEWLNLNPAVVDPVTDPVKLQDWDLSNPVLPGNLNILAGDFIGYATSTSGRNFSFNCESEIVGGNCIDPANPTKVSYKVYVGNVQVGYMSAPNWSYSQACAGTTLTANLTWQTRSGEQAAYEIVVNDIDSFSTSTSVCWSGLKYSASTRQYTIPNLDPDCTGLAYNTHYYWWIRVYSQDDEGTYIPSEWYQFGDGVTSVDNSVGNLVPKTFLTYSHRFPNPFFTWSPTEVKIGTTTFSGLTSSYYDNNEIEYDCEEVCQYEWSTFGDPGAEIYATTSATTSILFTTATNTTVMLKVTDPQSYYCSTSTVLSINYGLPIWREVKTENR